VQTYVAEKSVNAASSTDQLPAHTVSVSHSFLREGLQQNAGKSEAMLIGTAQQLHSTGTVVLTVDVARTRNK
jgi:hypothetical protein